MLKQLITLVTFLWSLTAHAVTPIYWIYGTGSNIDNILTSKAEFYRDGRLVMSYPGGGGGPETSERRIVQKRYYWSGGDGGPTNGIPIPDKAIVEIVSFHDKKRYRIKVDLPADLEQQMRQEYMVDGKIERRHWLYFGLAPGGYFEVLLQGLNIRPDQLLMRGIAEEVTDDWYDKKVPLARQYGIDDFDKKYGALFKQYPVPLGMDWAPIMDTYRAKQPRIDFEPVN
ncbi:hypothetical protein D3C79_637690 [compost metagenome]